MLAAHRLESLRRLNCRTNDLPEGAPRRPRQPALAHGVEEVEERSRVRRDDPLPREAAASGYSLQVGPESSLLVGQCPFCIRLRGRDREAVRCYDPRNPHPTPPATRHRRRNQLPVTGRRSRGCARLATRLPPWSRPPYNSNRDLAREGSRWATPIDTTWTQTVRKRWSFIAAKARLGFRIPSAVLSANGLWSAHRYRGHCHAETGAVSGSQARGR
jgi:hypothetical protein